DRRVGGEDRDVADDRLGDHAALLVLDPKAHDDVGEDLDRLAVARRGPELPLLDGRERRGDEILVRRRDDDEVAQVPLRVDPPEQEDVALTPGLQEVVRVRGVDATGLDGAARLGGGRGRQKQREPERAARPPEAFRAAAQAAGPSRARRAWYEERTSGPDSTRRNPISSPARRRRSNSSGV